MTRPKKQEDAAVEAWLGAHASWRREGATLTKTFSFRDYPSTLAFVMRLGFAAEKRDHHPDLVVTWGKVTVSWGTHDAGGITELDFELASRSDEIEKGG
jgi:4a-hydroxytetrahydrobiopterin dehydratase